MVQLDKEAYEHLVRPFNEKGRYYVADFLAHDWKIGEFLEGVMFVSDSGRRILVDHKGDKWELSKVI
jgi:hypothetical protein